jgi:hypothetical protein
MQLITAKNESSLQFKLTGHNSTMSRTPMYRPTYQPPLVVPGLVLNERGLTAEH